MLASLSSFLKRNSRWLTPVAFFVLAALVYLPLVRHFGFLNDDWYLMYDAHVKGPGFFPVIWASDRPARTFLQYPLYLLFGENLIFYQVSACIYRVFGALALWSCLGMVWPDQKRTNLLASLLFLIYPGFLSQPNAVDFQAHLFGLMLALISISLSVKSFFVDRKMTRGLLIGLSIILGWCYLGLMEYFIGMEVLRFLLIALLAWRQHAHKITAFIQSLVARYAVFILSPAGFLIWRLFFFQSERKATNVAAQVGQLFSTPLTTGLWWILYLFQDSLNVILSAWVVPLYNLAFSLRLRDLFPAVLLGALSAAVLWLAWRWLYDDDENPRSAEPLLVGLLAVLGGLLPVIMANRHVNFSDYSRYTIPAMVGGILVLSSLLMQIKSPLIRNALVIFLALNAGMTHYASAVNAAAQATATRSFWWQVAWRVPALKTGASLVADYPDIAIQEDYFVWGPANQIYYPEKQSGDQVEVPLSAIVLNPQNAQLIMVGKGQDAQVRRGNLTVANYNNVLVLTQPASNACVRILDGSQPEFSENDRPEIMLVGSASQMADVIPQGKAPTPPPAYFGGEPTHGWCYYYQKASLARQQGDWKSVASLSEKALAEGFYPSDKIEWMPLLQAYTMLGQKEKLHRFISILGESPFVLKQACTILSSSAAKSTDPAMPTFIKESFCK